jgi:hypothetical protein
MPLPTGSISINQIQSYVGHASGATRSLGDAAMRAAIGIATGAISMNSFRGLNRTYMSVSYPGNSPNATNGNWRRVEFSSSGTLTINHAPDDAPELYYCVVGGGGGGGGGISGGGGGGGMRTGTMNISPGSYPVVVGAGGSGGPGGPNSGNGSNGSSSSFNGITSAGGGRGGRFSAGNAGGSGGGGSVRGNPVSGWPGGNGNTPAVSPPQGKNGGTGSYTIPGNGAGGGGGGAEQTGRNCPGPYPTQDGRVFRGGPGGNGLVWSVEQTNMQVTIRYGAGGGGGCSRPGGAYAPAQTQAGSGGSGGGGAGSINTANAGAGSANRGAGGGGGGQRDAPQYRGAGGNGGSGLVRFIYKYQ